MNLNEFVTGISNGTYDSKLKNLCGPNDRQLLRHRLRYISAAENFSRLYPESGEISVFSAPGSIEICGSSLGSMLFAAVDRDIIAIVSLNDDNIVRIKCDSGELVEAAADEVNSIISDRKDNSSVLDMLHNAAENYCAEITGFNAYIHSDIPESGFVSASAARKELIRTVVRALFCKESKSEAGVNGGFTLICSNGEKEQECSHISFDLSGAGYTLCVTEMDGKPETDTAVLINKVVRAFGAESIGDVTEADFIKKLHELRKHCTDSELAAVLEHYTFSETAELAAEALSTGDSVEFLRLLNGINKENLSPECSLAVLLGRRESGGNGAVSVNSGNCVLAFLPNYLVDNYAAGIDRVFGFGKCQILSIRTAGSYELTAD